MREIVHLQAGQCGNQIGAKVSNDFNKHYLLECFLTQRTPQSMQFYLLNIFHAKFMG